MTTPSGWELVVGLEVHVQLDTRTKAFCGCPNRFGDPPNTNVCPVCLGLPGALPVLNDAAVDLALRTALALECDVPDVSFFARKNYFYPDLPKGYQISQYDRPLALGGAVPIEVDGERKKIALTRIHLEEDAGKSLHDETSGTSDTRIDLNRCGTPLIEIVSEPDLRRAEEASAYLVSLRRIVRYLGVSDGDMSQGSFRCDANVSLRRPGEPLGTKTEVKNLNSIKMVESAIGVEARRQAELLEGGGTVVQATLLWDEARETVRTMRTKEDADDYRYFPDPDLRPLVVSATRRDAARDAAPELPFARRDRFVSALGLPEYDAGVLTESRGLSEWFEDLATRCGDAKLASNWTMGEVLRVLNETNADIASFPIGPDAMAGLLALVQKDEISSGVAKKVFGVMLETGDAARAIVDREGLAQISDTSAMEAIVDDVLAANAEPAEQFRQGNEKVIGFLVGQVMKASQGKANPKLARELLIGKIGA